MRVQFDFTPEELVDVQLRGLARSKVARRWKWDNSLWMAIGLGFLAFVVVKFSLPSRIIFSLVVAAVSGGDKFLR